MSEHTEGTSVPDGGEVGTEEKEVAKPNSTLAREEPARDRDHRISDNGRQLAQYVRDLYDTGARMWTKDMFRDLEADLAKDPRPNITMIRSSEYLSI